MVITRSLDGQDSAGRIKTLNQISGVLEGRFITQRFRLHNLLETRRIGDLFGAVLCALFAILRGKPLPLQSILYSAGSEIRRLRKELQGGNFDAVYLDSVRSQTLLRSLRKRLPHCPVVVDFDDLMSRRMELILETRQPLSLGYLRESVSAPLRRLIELPLSGLIARYESAALRGAELEMANAARAVVLVSAVERDILQRRLPAGSACDLRAIPPPSPAARHPQLANTHRFVFIGSDRFPQNRLSIDFLVTTWRELGPRHSLHIYGRQQRASTETPNVFWHGYVEDLADVYTEESILLLPVLLAGGIKTKAIEAWSYGRPVLGNPYAFEGLMVENYPLVIPLADWPRFLIKPADYHDLWVSAAHTGNSYVRSALSAERYAAEWSRLFSPQPTSQIAPRDTRDAAA